MLLYKKLLLMTFGTTLVYFRLLQNVQTGPGGHPASCSAIVGVLFLGVRRLGCQFSHPLPSSAEVRMSGVILLLPLHALTF